MKYQIKSTLTLYEAEKGLPLSAFEIYRYLHKDKYQTSNISLCEIIKSLNKESYGFYSLSNNNNKHQLKRIEKDKISILKWKKIRKTLKLLQIIPFIKSIAVSGSLSMNNSSKNSDIDLFILTKKNRIWTVRTLCMLLTQILKKRRYNNKIKNKICLNYYMTENSIPRIRNIASANMFLRMIPIFNQQIFYNFLSKNFFWLKNYIKKPEKTIKINNLHTIKKNKCLLSIKNFFEKLLSKKFGDFIEKNLSKWQKNRIDKKTQKALKENKKITNLIFSDDILMFHWPKPRNEEILKKYNKTLNNF